MSKEPFLIKIFNKLFSEEFQVKVFTPSKIKEIINIVKKFKSGTCLEAGAAEGYILRFLLKNDYFKQGVAIDIRDYALERGRKSAKKEGILNKIKFKYADVTKLPFRKNEFDVVLLLDVLEHMKTNLSLNNTITECFRVSKKTLVIGIPQVYLNKPLSWLVYLDPDHFYTLIKNPKIHFVYSEEKFKRYLKMKGYNFKIVHGKVQNYFILNKR
jgi:ubiquinone/menaquinone biosynthesis C-methylase UbiE